jgi:hypothetical protein
LRSEYGKEAVSDRENFFDLDQRLAIALAPRTATGHTRGLGDFFDPGQWLIRAATSLGKEGRMSRALLALALSLALGSPAFQWAVGLVDIALSSAAKSDAGHLWDANGSAPTPAGSGWDPNGGAQTEVGSGWDPDG